MLPEQISISDVKKVKRTTEISQLQRLADALSEFDGALIDAQMKSVPGPNMTNIRHQRLLAEIDNDQSDISGSVCGIGEKIEQLKTFEGRH